MSKNTNISGQPIICQLLSFIPTELIKECVNNHNSDRYYKTMSTYRQMVFLLYGLITSVSGVGQIVAINTLVVTNEFKQIVNPKEMACNCGVVPFKYDSGKSVRSKAKVSHRANRPMKVLFHLAAMSAISSDGELKNYYLRKVEEGKNKMAVINAVRNKIIHRIFACVRNQRKYEKKYVHALA